MYKKNSHIHFVGIGGIGMSGIAILLKQKGYIISGCDLETNQDTITQLKKLGCSIYNGNNTNMCHDATIDILVYIPMYATTIPAITKEIAQARSRGILTISRACMLSELMRTKYSIAISGSHGKTTTSALIAHILREADIDPTVAIGGNLKNISSNASMGSGDFFVAEADESDKSFLQLQPTIAVITNIDLEHLETYTDLDDIKQNFKQFIKNVPFYGKAIICIDDANIRSIMPIEQIATLSYGIEREADFSAHAIIPHAEYSAFTVSAKNNTPLGTIILPMAGLHNIYNALAAIAVARELDINFTTIQQSIASFKGVDRRFSFHGLYKGAEIFDDYGHHPKEIENILAVARKRAKNKLIVVFQPHRYTRTQKLLHDFILVFSHGNIDVLIITDIYSAGEKPIKGISSKNLVQKIISSHPKGAIHYVPMENNFQQIKELITRSIVPNDLVLLLGAGKTNLIAQELTR